MESSPANETSQSETPKTDSLIVPTLAGFKSYPPREIDIAELQFDPENVNAHSDLDLTATGNSLSAFGQVETLVVDVKTKKVVGGNGRLQKMIEKGWKKAWIIEVEGTPDQLKTLAITLNETPRLSAFDYTKLTVALQELQHSEDQGLLALTGIPAHEFDILLGAEIDTPATVDTLKEDAPPVPAKTEEPSTKMATRGVAIQFTKEQRSTIEAAVAELRKELEANITPSEALTEVCRRFLDEFESAE